MLTLPEVWPAAMVMVSPLVKVTKMLFWATPPVKVAVYVIPLVTPSATLAVADRSTTTTGSSTGVTEILRVDCFSVLVVYPTVGTTPFQLGSGVNR